METFREVALLLCKPVRMSMAHQKDYEEGLQKKRDGQAVIEGIIES